MKTGTRTVPVSVTELKHRLDVNTLGELAAKTLSLNEVGFCDRHNHAGRLRPLQEIILRALLF